MPTHRELLRQLIRDAEMAAAEADAKTPAAAAKEPPSEPPAKRAPAPSAGGAVKAKGPGAEGAEGAEVRRGVRFFADLDDADNRTLTRHYTNRRGSTLRFLRDQIMPEPGGQEALTRLAKVIRDKRLTPSVTSYANINPRLIDHELPRQFSRHAIPDDDPDALNHLLDHIDVLLAISARLRKERGWSEDKREAYAAAHWIEAVEGQDERSDGDAPAAHAPPSARAEGAQER